MIGQYPATKENFEKMQNITRFTALEDDEIVGYFTLRDPGTAAGELRFGFVIVRPEKRGKGCGKAMLRLGIRYAFEVCGAKRLSLGVFENSPSAYYCNKSVGFSDTVTDVPETYTIMGETWNVKQLMLEP